MIMVEYHFAFGVTLFKVNNKQAIFFSTLVTGRKLCRCNHNNNNIINYYSQYHGTNNY